jgi:hypothetical protein
MGESIELLNAAGEPLEFYAQGLLSMLINKRVKLSRESPWPSFRTTDLACQMLVYLGDVEIARIPLNLKPGSRNQVSR